jgi:hypothetical protein
MTFTVLCKGTSGGVRHIHTHIHSHPAWLSIYSALERGVRTMASSTKSKSSRILSPELARLSLYMAGQFPLLLLFFLTISPLYPDSQTHTRLIPLPFVTSTIPTRQWKLGRGLRCLTTPRENNHHPHMSDLVHLPLPFYLLARQMTRPR